MTSLPARPDYRSYADYFAGDDNDPYQGQYKELLKLFRTTQTPSDARTLYRSVAKADSKFPTAYLSLYLDSQGTPRYQVSLSVSQYRTVLGQPTPWDRQVFAFSGDVVEGSITTIIFLTTAFEFHRVGGVHQNVPATLARGRELLAAEPDRTYLAALADDEPNIRQVKTRNYVPLPHRFVQHLLDRTPTAREGFIDLSLQLEALSDPDSCPKLVDWMLCSITSE